MVENYSQIAIGLSSLVLALLSFFQFFVTYMKSSNEKINALEQDKRDLENNIETKDDEIKKWKKHAYAERQGRVSQRAGIKKLLREYKMFKNRTMVLEKRYKIMRKENVTMKRKLLHYGGG